MEDNYRGIRESYATDRKFYITETKGKSKKTILKEVSAMLDSLPDHDDHEIIICEAGSHRIIEFLTEPDQTPPPLPPCSLGRLGVGSSSCS